MTRQLTLEDVPVVHTTDPVTSYEAAAAVTQSGKRASHCDLVLAAVIGQPGMTAGELGDRTGLGRVEAARRLTDLLRLHRVYQGSKRVCASQGTSQMTWWPVKGASE